MEQQKGGVSSNCRIIENSNFIIGTGEKDDLVDFKSEEFTNAL